MKDHKQIKKLTLSLLEEIGENPKREGLIKTPSRVAKAWEFFSQGYNINVQDIVNGAIFEEDCSEMIAVQDIEFFSMCEHHMIPFFGRCHVGYLPNKRIIGLSKIPRIVDAFSQRLQVQERLTSQIAKILKEILNPIGVGVVIEGRHLCMQMRGVQKQNSFATTSAMIGQFRDSAETRNEFLSIINMRQL
ncbi:MAG: GTP cyclohydrolase I FolE [Candidatus Marinimicrobia bacterium]|nr:GTP cyclohydrolase I FolE [Candidatus Neomarinimicrobiota bacterium]